MGRRKARATGYELTGGRRVGGCGVECQTTTTTFDMTSDPVADDEACKAVLVAKGRDDATEHGLDMRHA